MDFRGASADAVAALTNELSGDVSGDAALSEAAAGLFAASRTLRAEPALRRFATDASIEAAAKQGLVRDLFGGKLPEGALSVLTSAVGRRWTHGGDLPDALEHLGEVALARSTGTGADTLVDELFSVERAVQESPELRDALSDPTRSVADKEALVESLLAGKALPATVAFAKQALGGTYRTVTVALAAYQKVAAGVRDEGVATVRVAAPLTPEQETRLAAALARQYGREIHLNTLVDPAVVGGIKVEIGDDVIDGSIASRLDDAQRTLAGSAGRA
ncbi:MAG: F0F1 ATP synthase subunit delta [Nocardioides sp.]|uniref:F0F1 ATP synthase subunit delta n=1 Tax=Nocardioides sp. TaxID=35761 RepID=UPI0039E326E5